MGFEQVFTQWESIKLQFIEKNLIMWSYSLKITALYIDIKGIRIKTYIYEGTCCSNCVCNDDFPLDIRRRLNVHNVL